MKFLRNIGSWRVVPVLVLPAYPGGPSPIIPPPSPLPLLIPAASFQPGIPGARTPNTPRLRIAPFGVTVSANFYFFLPAHAVPSARSTLPVPALPSPGYPYSQVSRRAVLSLRILPLEPRCPRTEVAALPSAEPGGGGGAPAPALCAVIGRDSVCRCRPMMERGGTGGPAPLGAGMRRRRSHRDSGSESSPSPPSNARLPAAACRGRWAAA